MGQLIRACILAAVLALPVRAQERCAALIISSDSAQPCARQLLEGLYDRGIRATYLLRGSEAAGDPALVAEILEDGHEIGCRGFTGENMTYMSRRTVAAEILEFQALLPEDYPLRLFCPPGGCSDGVRQVAQARKLAIVSWMADAFWSADRIPDGALILLSDADPASVEKALTLADGLLQRDVQLLTVSQLAKARNVRLEPGKIYSAFPPGESGE